MEIQGEVTKELFRSAMSSWATGISVITGKSTGDITELLTSDQKIVDQPYWVRINGAEVAAGEARGKPRVKAVTVPDLLRLGQP